MKKLLSLFILFIASPIFSQITIEGTITDANGNAPILAHAHIGPYNDMKNSSSTVCSKDGHYSIQVPAAGVYSLRISAVDHEEISIPIVFDAYDKGATINVRLRPNDFVKTPDKITVIGDWNKFAFASTEQMTPQKTADGKTIYTYERTATGDTLSYQLMGTTAGGHSVNGTNADYFTYDGGGDYRSVIRTHKGDKVRITFDPSKVNFGNTANLPLVDIQNNPFLKEAREIILAQKKHTMDRNAQRNIKGPLTLSELKSDLAYSKQVYDDAFKSGNQKLAQFAAVIFAQDMQEVMTDKDDNPVLDFGTENANVVMGAVPAISPLWVMAPNEIVEITKAGDKNLGSAYEHQLKNNPEKVVRAIVYADEMEHAVAGKNESEWRRLYDILKRDYADVPEVKWSIAQNNPDAAVQVGKPIPSFEVALLDGSGNVSNTSMLGKYYMIDFWATWCGPCVHEMPAIHKAYEKFKGKKGFEILSLSMDASESQIAPFRIKKWKMPWMHAFIPGVFEAELAKKFEVAGIPKPVLVGPDGKVIAMQEDLRGETLEKTLGKYLGESN